MAVVHIVVDRGDAKAGGGHDPVFKLNAAGGRENGGVIEKHTLAEFDPVAEIADKRREDAYVVKRSAKQFLEKAHVGRIVRQRGVGLGAKHAAAHHLLHSLLKIGLAVVRGAAAVHQLIHVTGLVLHTGASLQQAVLRKIAAQRALGLSSS